jgi:hypothetical protein
MITLNKITIDINAYPDNVTELYIHTSIDNKNWHTSSRRFYTEKTGMVKLEDVIRDLKAMSNSSSKNIKSILRDVE